MSQVLKLNENEGVLCLESAQQLVNFSIVSRWIALTSQNRLVIFDGSGSSGSELIYDTTNDGPDKGKKEKSLIQKAITRSRTASSDCGDEPPKKLRIVPPNVETINELGNTNYDEHEMRSRKSTVSYQEYTNAECEVENYNIVDPAYEADISFEQMERMRITKDMSPKLADTDPEMPASPFLGMTVVCAIVVDKRLTCMIACNTLIIKRGDQIVKLRGLDLNDWKFRLEMTKKSQ